MAGFTDYFHSLSGIWQLNRKISDGTKFAGQAEFSWEGQYLRLSESGQLVMPDLTTMNARRSWLWLLKTHDQLEIYYDEQPPRLYHSLSLVRKDGVWEGSASHLCEPDTYAGTYKFSEGSFQIDQKVNGPKKDYSIASFYSM